MTSDKTALADAVPELGENAELTAGTGGVSVMEMGLAVLVAISLVVGALVLYSQMLHGRRHVEALEHVRSHS